MSTTKLIIYRYPNIYEILDELNNILKFNLIKIDDEEDLKLYIKNRNNYLIISKKRPFNEGNILIINDFPIKIDKLIEKINLKVLKNNFNFKSNISIGKYSLDENSRKIIYKNLETNLTEQEVKVLLYLKKFKKPVKVKDLQKHIWGYNLDLETHTVETHIYRLRQKFSKIFKDNNLIQSSKDGYFIN